jgi:hypothetical protein
MPSRGLSQWTYGSNAQSGHPRMGMPSRGQEQTCPVPVRRPATLAASDAPGPAGGLARFTSLRWRWLATRFLR